MIRAQTGDELARAVMNSTQPSGHLTFSDAVSLLRKRYPNSELKKVAFKATSSVSSSTSSVVTPEIANCFKRLRVRLWLIKTLSLYLVKVV